MTVVANKIIKVLTSYVPAYLEVTHFEPKGNRSSRYMGGVKTTRIKITLGAPNGNAIAIGQDVFELVDRFGDWSADPEKDPREWVCIGDEWPKAWRSSWAGHTHQEIADALGLGWDAAKVATALGEDSK